MTVSLVNYGLGNLGSVVNMLKRVGAESRLVQTPEEILASERLLLPGIGAFDTGMRLLNEQGLVPAIREFAASGKPLFGICLGMQLLLDGSEEGVEPGLGLIPGTSKKFAEQPGVRVPHMGWNHAVATHDDPLMAGLDGESRFYFVHSYRVHVDDEKHSILKCTYGITFDAAVQNDNIFGAQFHPEKSHKFGMQLLKNFADL